MVPKLRFNQFHSSWCAKKLGEVGEIISGLTYSPENIRNSGLLVLRSSNIQSGKLCFEDCVYVDLIVDDEKKTRKNDILICVRNGSRSLIGKNTLIKEVNQETTHGAFMTVFRGPLNSYVAQLLQTKKFYSQVYSDLGATINSINGGNLKRYSFSFPSDFNETAKIADFLSSVDDKIMLLNKQYEQLCHYKKGMMQKIFNQKLRFKDDSGDEFSDWEEVELKKIASKVNTKNRDNSVSTVLTNSATQGIVSQETYFEREIVTESNLTGYYVVRVGDFVYNPRISSTAPVGPIKMNELTQGVMSPLYTVFRFEKGLLKFYQYFFESSVWHDYLKSVANSGARHDRMNISGADFFGLPVPQPFEEEQTKIANFLSGLDDKITTKKTELDKLKTWKQGLLQQMFV